MILQTPNIIVAGIASVRIKQQGRQRPSITDRLINYQSALRFYKSSEENHWVFFFLTAAELQLLYIYIWFISPAIVIPASVKVLKRIIIIHMTTTWTIHGKVQKKLPFNCQTAGMMKGTRSDIN